MYPLLCPYTRNATPHSAMHRASMGATDGQRIWPKTRKNLGKPGFLSGEDMNRTFGCFPNVLETVREVPETIHSGPCFVVLG